MIDRTTRLRWRRLFRRSRRQVEDLGQQAEDQLEQNFFRRIPRLASVQRFVVSWVLLIVLLSGGVVVQALRLTNYYQRLTPAAGGSFTEGVLGAFTNANPLFATSPVDATVAKLVFGSLFMYNQQNKLVGDLASNWTVDSRGTQYTITLRNNLYWQDGVPLTADDVVFTYQTIEDPDAQSPLISGWQGVKVSAPNPHTIVFVLPNALTAFPNSLTNGIVPKHLLASIPASELRSAPFNTSNIVGAGPFRWVATQVQGDTPDTRQERIGLAASTNYHAGSPKLDSFVVRSFRQENQLLASFQRHELNAVAGLDSIPDTLANQADLFEYNIPVTGEVMVFFRTSQEVLSDTKVRQALVSAVNTRQLVEGLSYPDIIANEPLLQSQLGYDKSLTQLPFNLASANNLLDSDGWIKGKNGLRTKNGKPLTFNLYSQNTSEYTYVTQQLQAAWQNLGVSLQVTLQSGTDLQTTIATHSYDALLYGISIGTDPDVFAYWDSSQADPRLATRFNFSEYKSLIADAALEAGRTRSDQTLRIIKYRPFLQAWRSDAPALALYQPRFLYVTRGPLYNFDPLVINGATDRLSNVQNWMIREARVDE